MKNKGLLIILLLVSFVLSSCREISILTTVNKDGSFIRTIIITGDSAEVFKTDLPYPVDNSWSKEFKPDSTGKKDFMLCYTKRFGKSSELNREMMQDSGWRKQLNRTIEIKRTFGFFYSYLHYDETIKAANPFVLLDYNDFISKEEMLWLSGEKLALNKEDSILFNNADQKAESFLQNAVTEDIMAALYTCTRENESLAYLSNDISKSRDSIFNKIKNWDDKPFVTIIDSIADWSNNEDVLKLKTVAEEPFEKIDQRFDLLEQIFFMESYQVEVKMPGLLTGTNASSLMGNQVSWKVTPQSILFKDLHMQAESRIVNTWMFIIAGIVLLLFVGLMAYKSFKSS